MRELHPTNWLRYAGILTWCLVGIALLLAPLYARQPLTAASIIGAWSAMTLFLMAFLHPWSRMRLVAPFWQRVIALGVMTAAVIAVSYFSRSAFGAILSTVIAGILPWLLPRVLGIAWLF